MPTRLIGDSLRLRQVLNNPASNALKFSEAGDALTLTIGLQRETNGYTVLNFSVEDTGVGMTTEQQQ